MFNFKELEHKISNAGSYLKIPIKLWEVRVTKELIGHYCSEEHKEDAFYIWLKNHEDKLEKEISKLEDK